MRDASKTTGGHSAGEIVNNKKLIEYLGLNAHRHHKWRYMCLHCDSIHEATYNHLKRYDYCRVCRVGENSPTYKGYGLVTGTYMDSLRRGALKRNLPFNVTARDLWDLWQSQSGRCYFSDQELEMGKSASVDRLDNDRGYEVDNVAWVHRDINRMKSDFPSEYFIEMCRSVSKYQKEK